MARFVVIPGFLALALLMWSLLNQDSAQDLSNASETLEEANAEANSVRLKGRRKREADARPMTANQVAETVPPINAGDLPLTGATVPFHARVVDERGTPVDDCEVEAWSACRFNWVTPGESMRANSKGNVEGDLESGRYDLWFRSPTLGTLFVQDYVHDGAQENVLDVRLIDRLGIRVLVKESGTPSPGITVHVARLRGDDDPRRIVYNHVTRSVMNLDDPDFFFGPSRLNEHGETDANGIATFHRIPKGTYRVTVFSKSAGLFVDDPPSCVAYRRLTDQPVELSMSLPRFSKVRGCVRAIEEVPYATANLVVQTRVEEDDSLWSASQLVAIGDDFEMSVPVGRVASVRVNAEGFAAWPAPEWRGLIKSKLSSMLRGEDRRLDVDLSKGHKLVGTALTSIGDPVPAVYLRLTGHESGEVATTSTDADGVFRVEGLNPDRYSIRITTPRILPLQDQQAFVTVPSGAGEPTEFNIRVARATTLQGIVVNSDGTPQPAARVWIVAREAYLRELKKSRNRRLEAFTDASGHFAFDEIHPQRDMLLCAEIGNRRSAQVPIKAGRAKDKLLRIELPSK